MPARHPSRPTPSLPRSRPLFLQQRGWTSPSSHVSILRRWHVKRVHADKNSQQNRSLTQVQFMRSITPPGANCGLRAKNANTCCRSGARWGRLHLSIKVSNCGVLQQTNRALGRLLAGIKACQKQDQHAQGPASLPTSRFAT